METPGQDPLLSPFQRKNQKEERRQKRKGSSIQIWQLSSNNQLVVRIKNPRGNNPRGVPSHKTDIIYKEESKQNMHCFSVPIKTQKNRRRDTGLTETYRSDHSHSDETELCPINRYSVVTTRWQHWLCYQISLWLKHAGKTSKHRGTQNVTALQTGQRIRARVCASVFQKSKTSESRH